MLKMSNKSYCCSVHHSCIYYYGEVLWEEGQDKERYLNSQYILCMHAVSNERFKTINLPHIPYAQNKENNTSSLGRWKVWDAT